MTISEATLKRINGYVDFIKTFALNAYGIDIRGLPYDVVPSIQAPLGAQPGLYLDGKIGSRMMGKKVLGDGYANDNRVLIAKIDAESGVNQYWGVIFHEFGHATFDAARKNGEPGAWTVELMGLAKYATEADTSVAGAAREFAKARRGSGCFSSFGTLDRDYTADAKAAYKTLTGEDL